MTDQEYAQIQQLREINQARLAGWQQAIDNITRRHSLAEKVPFLGYTLDSKEVVRVNDAWLFVHLEYDHGFSFPCRTGRKRDRAAVREGCACLKIHFVFLVSAKPVESSFSPMSFG